MTIMVILNTMHCIVCKVKVHKITLHYISSLGFGLMEYFILATRNIIICYFMIEYEISINNAKIRCSHHLMDTSTYNSTVCMR